MGDRGVDTGCGCGCKKAICVVLVDPCDPDADMSGFEVSATGGVAATTGPGGVACIAGLEAGSHAVAASRGGCSAESAPIEAGAGGEAVEVEVDCGGAVPLCVHAPAACSSSGVGGVAVTVSDEGGAVGSAVTNASGVACILVPRRKSYVVTATKPDCTPAGWEGVDVGCFGADVSGLVQCHDQPGTLCVTVSTRCSASRAGFSVSATGPGGSGGGTTNSSGVACFTLPPGDYTVTVSKSGCESATAAVTIPCGGSAAFATTLGCDPGGLLRITVVGCYDSPVPGATVVVTPPGGGAPVSRTTGADGQVTIPLTVTGTYTVAITPPNERLAPATVETIMFACGALPQSIQVALSPAEGYQCCEIQKTVTPFHPFPIKTTLRITDLGGSFTVPLSYQIPVYGGCYVQGCVVRTMEQVGNPSTYVWSCYDAATGTGNNIVGLREDEIGTGDAPVSYRLAFGTSPFGTQAVAGINTWPVGHANGEDDDPCPAVHAGYFIRRWRLPVACGGGTAGDFAYSGTAVVNSLMPLNITYTFGGGNGQYGPMPYDDYAANASSNPLAGDPYSSTVTLTEA